MSTTPPYARQRYRRMSMPIVTRRQNQALLMSQSPFETTEADEEARHQLEEVKERMLAVARVSEEVLQENELHVKRIADLEDDLKEAAARTASVKEELSRAQVIIHSVEADRQELERKLDEKDDQIALLSEELASNQYELEENVEHRTMLRHHTRTVEEEMSQLKRNMTIEADSTLRQIEGEKAQLTDKVTDLAQENQQQERKINKLNKSMRQLSKLLETNHESRFQSVLGPGEERKVSDHSGDETTVGPLEDMERRIRERKKESDRRQRFMKGVNADLQAMVRAGPVKKKDLFFLLQRHCEFLNLIPPLEPTEEEPIQRKRHDGFAAIRGETLSVDGKLKDFLDPLTKKEIVIAFFDKYSRPRSWEVFQHHDQERMPFNVFAFNLARNPDPVHVGLAFLYPLSVLFGHSVGVRKPSVAYAIVLTLSVVDQIQWFSALFATLKTRLLVADDPQLYEFVYSLQKLVVSQHDAIARHVVGVSEMNGRLIPEFVSDSDSEIHSLSDDGSV